MRILSKGGVWKNTEDEILKAAVMKYGKNQWARISSLLVRKSAKQCKARWYEWLDPSIKKTEWSREEEEKLLHLAKIMPNQWRSIAPIIGRTASQCIEHYEKLLDAATNKEEDYDPAEDPRRLRPGEIDPNPEAKPARPDPVDMDEDEKEMLSEARARLANTKGKKAKRKAREKQLEEARRLAALQKRRELKAAGIELPKPRRKMKGIDYNKEIPFQKQPPPGFYEVDFSKDEDKSFRSVSLQDLEGKRRKETEDESKKEDVKKQRKNASNDLPAQLERISKLNEAEQIQIRPKLIMPDPQLSDRDLEQFSKTTTASMSEIEGEGSSATRTLLPNFKATPVVGRTPLRTPLPMRTPTREDNIMKEAQNLVALTATETPLHGGQNPMLYPSDFSRALPKSKELVTPNIISTPSLKGGMTPSFKTPLKPHGIGATPLRDTLNINPEDELSLESKFGTAGGQRNFREKLREGLKSLPAPQNDYQIELPELPEEDQEQEEHMDEDASDKLEAERKRTEALEIERLALRSQVLKRELPRPFTLSQFEEFSSKAEDSLVKKAEELIRTEMLHLISNDSQEVPMKSSKISSYPAHWDHFRLEEIDRAKEILQKETEEYTKEVYPNSPSQEEFEKIWNEIHSDWIYIPSKSKYVRSSSATKPEKLDSLNHEFENIRSHISREVTKAKNLERKLVTYYGGYEKRGQTLLSQIQALASEGEQAETELICFQNLQNIERKGIENRIGMLKTLVQMQESKEAEKQLSYRNLTIEYENVSTSIKA